MCGTREDVPTRACGRRPTKWCNSASNLALWGWGSQPQHTFSRCGAVWTAQRTKPHTARSSRTCDATVPPSHSHDYKGINIFSPVGDAPGAGLCVGSRDDIVRTQRRSGQRNLFFAGKITGLLSLRCPVFRFGQKKQTLHASNRRIDYTQPYKPGTWPFRVGEA